MKSGERKEVMERNSPLGFFTCMNMMKVTMIMSIVEYEDMFKNKFKYRILSSKTCKALHL